MDDEENKKGNSPKITVSTHQQQLLEESNLLHEKSFDTSPHFHEGKLPSSKPTLSPPESHKTSVIVIRPTFSTHTENLEPNNDQTANLRHQSQFIPKTNEIQFSTKDITQESFHYLILKKSNLITI